MYRDANELARDRHALEKRLQELLTLNKEGCCFKLHTTDYPMH
jgi:hypothetical protein